MGINKLDAIKSAINKIDAGKRTWRSKPFFMIIGLVKKSPKVAPNGRVNHNATPKQHEF